MTLQVLVKNTSRAERIKYVSKWSSLDGFADHKQKNQGSLASFRFRLYVYFLHHNLI